MSNFIDNVKSHIQEAGKFKTQYPEFWKDSYDSIVSELNDILVLANIDVSEAKHKFMLMPVSKFNNFGNYLKSIDEKIDTDKVKIQNREVKRKMKKICMNCGCNSFTVVNDTYVCRQCLTELELKKKNTQFTSKELVDFTKHINKQLNMIMGVTIMSHNMKVIFPYVIEWFLKRKLMYEWLKFNNNVNGFINKFNKTVNNKIDKSFFEHEIDRNQNNIIEYMGFKLICDEFYKLTQVVLKYRNITSNITVNDDINFKIQIFDEYVKLNGVKIPEATETVKLEIDGKSKTFEIGKYISFLLVNNVDLNFKKAIKEKYNLDLKLPGMNFDYSDLYYKKGTFPKKFVYQQNYIPIIYQIYNITPFNINYKDKELMIKLIIDFNNFNKQRKKKDSNNKSNSCLWEVSLMCILKLPYFIQYKDIIKILPKKIMSTNMLISENWFLYRLIKKEELEKFQTPFEKVNDENEIIKEVKESDKEIDKIKLKNFINNVGNNYGSNISEEYIKEKNNFNGLSKEWFDNYKL